MTSSKFRSKAISGTIHDTHTMTCLLPPGMAARLVSQGVAGTDARPLIVWNRSTEKASDFAASFPSN